MGVDLEEQTLLRPQGRVGQVIPPSAGVGERQRRVAKTLTFASLHFAHDSHEQTLPRPEADANTLRSVCEAALTLGEQQERLIEALLALATSERGIERWETLDLAEITRTVASGRDQDARRQNIHIKTTLGPATTTSDPKLVESLVADLLDNAIRHNTAGGNVEAATASTASHATVTVSNTGPKVASEEIERLFQPFQQIGRERVGHRDGHGLGLSIVQAIARAHGAKISTQARPQGGLDIEVSFPVNGATAGLPARN